MVHEYAPSALRGERNDLFRKTLARTCLIFFPQTTEVRRPSEAGLRPKERKLGHARRGGGRVAHGLFTQTVDFLNKSPPQLACQPTTFHTVQTFPQRNRNFRGKPPRKSIHEVIYEFSVFRKPLHEEKRRLPWGKERGVGGKPAQGEPLGCSPKQ